MAKLVLVDEAYTASLTGPSADRHLKGGDDGGNSGGMEARLARLEAHMEHVLADAGQLRSDVAKLKIDLATLTERVAHLPSKGFIVSALSIGLALLGALTLFGPNLRLLFGLS